MERSRRHEIADLTDECRARPIAGVPEQYVTVNGTMAMQWFQDLSIFAVRNGSAAYQVGINYEFWGDFCALAALDPSG